MRTGSIVTLLTILLVALVGCGDQAVTDPVGEPVDWEIPGISAQMITAEPLSGRNAFTDDVAMQLRLKPEGRSRTVVNLKDASNIAVLEITVDPEARFPWHTHPGPVMVVVTEGDFVYVYADDCVERHYPEGTALVDPGFDNVHYAFNPSTEDETVVLGIFFGAPDAGLLTLPVDEPEALALDEKCGVGA